MSRFTKHLGQGKELIIDNDVFIIKPLTTDEAPLFLQLMGASDSEGFDLKNITPELSNIITQLLNHTLRISFPEEWKENETEVKSFGMTYMTKIMPALFEVNMPPGKENKEKLEALKEQLKTQG